MSPDASNKGSGYGTGTGYTVSGGFVIVTFGTATENYSPSCSWTTA